MEDERRHAELAKLDLDIKAAARTVDELTPIVGDPDAVWDEHGWYPSERRALALEIFAERRVNEVRELRGRVAARRHHPNAVREQSGRARSGEALLRDTARLRVLEAIPPLDAADMCSECPTPAAWHSLNVTFDLDPAKDVGRVDGPCPAWPWWREWLEEARRQILAIASHKGEPPMAIQRPIAVIDSGLPIEEVIARLNVGRSTIPAHRYGAAPGTAGRSGCQTKRNDRRNSHGPGTAPGRLARSPSRTGPRPGRRKPGSAVLPGFSGRCPAPLLPCDRDR
jgi:hypothetical protein